MKTLLTILLFLTATPLAYSQYTKEDKEKILNKLIDGAECEEILDNCQEYSKTQEAVIKQLEEKNKTLTFGFDEVKNYNDALFSDNYNLKLELSKREERSYRKTNALIIFIAVSVIEGFIISQR